MLTVDLFSIYLLPRVDTNSLYRGGFYVWASGLCSLYRRIRYIEARYIEVLFHTFYCNFGRDVKSRSLYRGLGVIIFLCGISLPLFILWANFSPFPLRIAVYRILIRNNSRLLNEMTLYFDIKKY